MESAWLTFMLEAKVSFGHFLQLFFQSLCFLTCGKSLTDLSTNKVFFCIFAQVPPLSAFYLSIILVVKSLIWHIRDAKDFVHHLLPPALTSTAVCDALGPLLVHLVHGST